MDALSKQPKIPDDLIVCIAERADIKTIFALMASSKRTYGVIKKLERSICITNQRRFMFPPRGNIFSSEICLRRRIKNGTFAMVKEMEMREERIAQVLKSSFMQQALNAPPGGVKLTSDEEQERLLALLARAMAQCDEIADIGANEPCAQISPQWYSKLVNRGFNRLDLPLDDRLNDPYTNYLARPTQREYIKSLSLEDAVMLSYLINVMGVGYYLWSIDTLDSDTSFPERITSFKECVLRHGSWFAWAHVCGNTGWRSMAVRIADLGFGELLRFELGEYEVPRSLQSVLLERLDRLTSSPHEPISLYQAVTGLTKGQKLRLNEEVKNVEVVQVQAEAEIEVASGTESSVEDTTSEDEESPEASVADSSDDAEYSEDSEEQEQEL
ncbi:hypothetical protein M426DRAFT_16093 [Hypoxylon sp. CI-4A]|nr:hypothetical protein M426DRAFT_16093 [Hypoxylon sp. CI-4A]